MGKLTFIKMHGLGNDFVVFDARIKNIKLDASTVRAIADRRTGVGCDQLIVMEPAHSREADLFMRIYNSDGSEVDACGNATRCIAAKVMDENATDQVTIETGAGLLDTKRKRTGITVNYGQAYDDWKAIPLSREMNTLNVDLSEGILSDPVCVNIGNPHAVFFVDKLESVPLSKLGPKLETNALFPEHANIEAVQVMTRNHLKVRVWERGVGITQACGTGACAALIAACRRGYADRNAEVELAGGIILVEWNKDNQVLMTGPTATSFTGTWQFKI